MPPVSCSHMICPVCRTPNADDAVSCERCSSSLEADLQTVFIDPRQATGVSDPSSRNPWSEAPAAAARGSSAGLRIGDVIADRYEILKQLGEGGMGTVYQALDRELDRIIALKIIRADLAANASTLRRFKQEILLARQITHKNVIRIFDLGVAGRLRFITMEFVDGEDLNSLLQRRGKLTPSEAISIIRQVCEGLQAAHAEDVVHRDLKPQNILVDPDGQVRIMDFGLARSFEQAGITHAGMIVGTPDYMSPEQARGEQTDARSDVFAVGIIFYELLTGERPFPAESVMAALLKRARERARPIEAVDPAIPKRLSQIVMRCLEPDLTRRYQRAAEILRDLDSDTRFASAHPRSTGAAFTPDPFTAGVLTPGAMLGARYRIEAELGEGGMGKVYRATDLELHRTVALKVVRPQLADDPKTVERLKQEILLTSRISHPNVLRVHDLGEADGLRFISMAWVDGEDLSVLIQRSGPLSEERIRILAEEICAGLDAAHRQGIVHRDLNPRNILLQSSGHVCIGDFGLAETLNLQQAAQLTQVSDLSGTPRYMSPEQAEGKAVDQRTDIYSLGLVLYEMATGQPAFKSDSALQTMYQRVTAAPRNPKLLNPALSEQLAASIMRCLERDPNQRYGNASELLEDLRRSRAALPARRKWLYPALAASIALMLAAVVFVLVRNSNGTLQPSRGERYIAVLPFRTLSSEADLKYEADGIAEAISSRLFSLSAVHLVSPVALQGLSLAQPVANIARQVGANIVVQGTVQAQGDRIAVIANIDDVQRHTRLWSKAFTGMRADFLTLEDQLATQLVSGLHLSTTAADRDRSSGPPTQNLEAYDLYLEGRDNLKNHRDEQGAKWALDLFQQACAKDSSFALAWAGIADSSLLMYRLKKESFWAEKALAAARQAETSNGALPEVHFALGSVFSATGKNSEAIEEIKRALQLAPNSDNGYIRLGHAYIKAGQSDAGLKALSRAVELNPYYWDNHMQLGIAYLQVGRNDDALKEFKQVTELNPRAASAYNNIGVVYYRQSRWSDCLPYFQKAIELKPSYDAYSNVGTALFYLGRYREAIGMFQKAVQMDPNQEAAVANLADAYRQDQEWEKAQATYDRAIELTYEQLEVNPQDASALGDLALYYAKKGGRAKALQLVSRARTIDATDNSLMYEEAVVDTLAGHSQEALQALERALSSGYSVGEARSDPDLKALHSLPEFELMLDKHEHQK